MQAAVAEEQKGLAGKPGRERQTARRDSGRAVKTPWEAAPAATLLRCYLGGEKICSEGWEWGWMLAFQGSAGPPATTAMVPSNFIALAPLLASPPGWSCSLK